MPLQPKSKYCTSFESYDGFQCHRVAGKPHSSDYWEQNGITDPTRDDYIFHIEFNHVHDYGLGTIQILRNQGDGWVGQAK